MIKLHCDHFEKKIEPNLEKTFDEIIDMFKNEEHPPISEPFHLIKSIRSRLLQHLLLIESSKSICLNTSLWAQTVVLGPVFNDKSKYGSMKDSYPLAMISWYSFTQTLIKG